MIFKLWAILGFIFLFLEMMIPSMFFLPLGGASFFSAIAAFKYPDNYWIQGIVFAVFALLFFLVANKFISKKSTKEEQTGVEAKYIGKEAYVVEDIAKEATEGIGAIKIYGEVWQAKSIDDCEIKAGEMVKIIRNESLIMYVEKCNKE